MNIPSKLRRQEVTQHFRARLSPHIARLSKQSEAIYKQFVPDIRELDNRGLIADPFEAGRNYKGLKGVERIYRDRIVLTPHFDCSAYCRYCFKKTRTLAGGESDMSNEDIDRAMQYIRADTDLEIALITGGDPLRDEIKLFRILDGLKRIPHVHQVRIGTRNLLFDPKQVTNELADRIAAYSSPNPDDLSASQVVAIALSINHPDELSPAVVRSIRKFVVRGIAVKGQVTLLKGINDNSSVLLELYQRFTYVGMQPYYLFHCMPVLGTAHFRTSVARGQELLRELAALSGVYAPTYVYVTKVGKIRVGIDSPLDVTTYKGQPYIRCKTIYKAKDFLRFSDCDSIPYPHFADRDGNLVTLYPDGSSV